MDRSRQQFLARPGVALDEDWQIGDCRLARFNDQISHLGAGINELLELRVTALD